ncbi:MAG TPA: right-handed parallel beta-helix repeat-containing protein, partial [archaeon]|nr:right-handed parallel beta-helix repeat-containing protein [archaeon]
MKRFTIQCLSLLLIAAFKLYGAHYYVSAAGTVYGDGTESNPFPWIELGLERAGPGDTVELAPDEFYEKVSFPRSGKSGAPIVLLGCLCFGTVLHADGTVIDVDQKHIIIDFMQIDGGFGESEVIRVGENADSLIIRNSEIRNSRGNGIDINRAEGVLIENCTIHHLLAGRLENQKATYGVAGKGATDLTVLRCEIYKVSG